jgi:hypothetical protein
MFMYKNKAEMEAVTGKLQALEARKSELLSAGLGSSEKMVAYREVCNEIKELLAKHSHEGDKKQRTF